LDEAGTEVDVELYQRRIANRFEVVDLAGLDDKNVSKRRIPAADDLESIEPVHFRFQGTESYPAIQSNSQPWRILRGSVFPILLARGAVSADRSIGHPSRVLAGVGASRQSCF